MKLPIDMNLSPRWVRALEDRGVAAEHWRDVGDPAASDAVIFAHAAANGSVVLTSDLDFGTILAASGGGKPSVVQLRTADLRPEAGVDAVALALSRCRSEIEAGALLTLDAARLRITLLPLRAR